ncbi:AVN_collapsed_G0046620.mRNA.1.CDS.1 [Saccharomyces cerevisiae]|nr:AVN_collapsed_G0046620.mRNA.1.CDS.1 [Saccharomyces cerevisiae]
MSDSQQSITVLEELLATATKVERTPTSETREGIVFGAFLTLKPGDSIAKRITDPERTIFDEFQKAIQIDWETINIKETDHNEGV